MTCRNGSHYECEKGCQWLTSCEERYHYLARHLAIAVTEWVKVDDEVARDGWSHGTEEKWDNLRTEMVSLANQLKEMNL